LNLITEVSMKAIPIRHRHRRQRMGLATKVGLVLLVVAALCLEVVPLINGRAATAAAPIVATPSAQGPDFIPNRLPDRAQIEKMEVAEPLSTF